MRKAFLKAARESLLSMRALVLEGIESESKQTREAQKDDAMDAYDLASEERDRDISMILSDRDRQKLLAIDDAIDRIKEGTYGVCEMCELEVSEDRLKALPFTRLCISCQSDMEKEQKLTRRQEDASFRRFAVGEVDEEKDNS